MGLLKSVKSSILGMRCEETVGATSASRAKEASVELRAEDEKTVENRKMAAILAILKVSQLAESRRDKAVEAATDRAASGNVDPDVQRQLMAS
ncbi:MAG: hypothetical protein HOL45_05290 [Chloroflexi bacterium]|nr:hypothetical protein [Chloroflexota bacterium]